LSGGLHPPPEVGWLNSRLPFWCTGLAGALVLAQCLHYWAVLVKLPAQVKIWPTPRWRWAALALSGLMSVGFIWDFSAARGWYAVAAGAHAWLEWPLLLYGLLVLRPTERPTLVGAPSIPLA